jgi:hypothetical protein
MQNNTNRILKTIILSFILVLSLLSAYCQKDNRSSGDAITGYYTRLPFDDGGFTGKYADIIVDLSNKGRFVFSREYSYQPYWIPVGGSIFLVERLVTRSGDGPPERPDKNNICSNAAIVEKTSNSVKVHWRYAPDMTRPTFVDFRAAYNKAGNPSEFYSEYTDEYFTINANGSIIREVKKGCYSLDDWNDPQNRIIQKLMLSGSGITQTEIVPARLQNTPGIPVSGEKIKKTAISGRVVNFKFDDGMVINLQQTKENVTDTITPVKGVKAYWRKGVSGTCLSFDSYSNAVVLPSSRCPQVNNNISIEAWIAPQEYPFNWAAIVDHLNDKRGYFLGINVKGHIGFRIGLNDSIYEVVTEAVPLYKWTQVTATYNSKNGLTVYLNGVSAGFRSVKGTINDANNTDIYVGMTHSFRQYPAGAERLTTKNFNTNIVFSGLIDEVSIYNRELSPGEILSNFHTLKPDIIQPLKAWILPDGPVSKTAGFGAQYSRLQYSPEWDGLWRVGNYADITVPFDNVPWRYVFWRGTRYMPSLVTDYGPKSVWSSDQSPESFWKGEFGGECYENMSDKLCRYSNVRIISSTDARVVIHWRVSSPSIAYKWPMGDENGWGIWTDEYWTIYPDGVSVRHQVVHNNTSATINCEMNQNEILHHPGQTTDDVLLDETVIGANLKGETQSWYHSGKAFLKGQKNDKNLQYTNLNSGTKQFEIGEPGTWIETFLTVEDYWNGWNHFPVQLIPSDGTDISQYDRPVSTCPSTLHEVRRVIDKKTMEAMDIYGLTNKKITDLTPLNRSWNNAPEVSDVKGCISNGYEKRERAYKFTGQADEMSFKISATDEKPVENIALIINNWRTSNTDNLSLTLNGKLLTSGREYKKGIEIGTDGKYVLVLWLEYSSDRECNIMIGQVK